MVDLETIPIGWERGLMASENVKERLRRATSALDEAGVPYAVVGGNAVSEWVSRVDPGAARYTKDVDILLNRGDFDDFRIALEGAGFEYHHVYGVDCFIDGPKGRPSEGVHLLFAGEKLKPSDLQELPLLEESERGNEFQVVSLEGITRMKLMAWRDRDRTHLRDLIGVGLLNATWLPRFQPALAARLQQLLDDPDG